MAIWKRIVRVAMTNSIYNVRAESMKKVKILSNLFGKDYLLSFLLLSMSSLVVIWCLAFSILTPFEHLSCPLFSIF